MNTVKYPIRLKRNDILFLKNQIDLCVKINHIMSYSIFEKLLLKVSFFINVVPLN